MASQIQLLIALLVLLAIVAVAAVGLQSGATVAPRFAGTGGTQPATGYAGPVGQSAEGVPVHVVNVFPAGG
ncbi:MAG TPA: hypothetical protein VJB16_02810 [archaeon]|nr:hypothetical protein [archaeon]